MNIKIPSVVRGFLTRKRVLPEWKKQKTSAIKIQSLYRGHVERKKVRLMKDEQHQSAIKLQRGTMAIFSKIF